MNERQIYFFLDQTANGIFLIEDISTIVYMFADNRELGRRITIYVTSCWYARSFLHKRGRKKKYVLFMRVFSTLDESKGAVRCFLLPMSLEKCRRGE